MVLTDLTSEVAPLEAEVQTHFLSLSLNLTLFFFLHKMNMERSSEGVRAEQQVC